MIANSYWTLGQVRQQQPSDIEFILEALGKEDQDEETRTMKNCVIWKRTQIFQMLLELFRGDISPSQVNGDRCEKSDFGIIWELEPTNSGD